MNINTPMIANNFADQEFLPDVVKNTAFYVPEIIPEKILLENFLKIGGKVNMGIKDLE
jgi:hypothetical protein